MPSREQVYPGTRRTRRKARDYEETMQVGVGVRTAAKIISSTANVSGSNTSATVAASAGANLSIFATSPNGTVVAGNHTAAQSYQPFHFERFMGDSPCLTASSAFTTVCSEGTARNSVTSILVSVAANSAVAPLPGRAAFCKNGQHQLLERWCIRHAMGWYVLRPPQHPPPIGQHLV